MTLIDVAPTRTHAGKTSKEDDVRLDAALGGGCMMDLGCYDVMAIRFLWCGSPPVVRLFMHHPNEKFTGLA